MGYTSNEPKYLKGRLENVGILHHNKYQRLSEQEMDTIIREYDNEEKHLGSTMEDWKELGFNHYLEWFYTRRSREIPKEKLQEFYDMLEKTGFIEPDYFDE